MAGRWGYTIQLFGKGKDDIMAEWVPNPKLFIEWLQHRPFVVREAARRYPPGTVIKLGSKDWYLIGYQETDESVALMDVNAVILILSEIDPRKDPSAAGSVRTRKEYVSLRDIIEEPPDSLKPYIYSASPGGSTTSPDSAKSGTSTEPNQPPLDEHPSKG